MTEIHSLFETYKTAVYQKDIEAFTAIYDTEVRVFDMWEQWTYEGLAAWREMAIGWFASLGENRDVITFDNIRIQAGTEMAAASALVRYTAVSKNGEELRYLENRLSWVAQKKEQSWKVIHQHSSSPIDFKTMKVILKRPTYESGK